MFHFVESAQDYFDSLKALVDFVSLRCNPGNFFIKHEYQNDFEILSKISKIILKVWNGHMDMLMDKFQEALFCPNGDPYATYSCGENAELVPDTRAEIFKSRKTFFEFIFAPQFHFRLKFFEINSKI